MKKHALRVLITALLVASTVLPLFACGNGNTPSDTAPLTTVEQPTEAPDTTPPETSSAETKPETLPETLPETKPETEPETPAETEPETEPEPLPPLSLTPPEAFGEVTITYECDDGSILYTYSNSTAEDFENACAYYEGEGCSLYNTSDMGGNVSSTYLRGASMAHLYRHPSNGELNVVLSETAGATLPPATPAVTDGEYECTVTQFIDPINVNGMNYIIQLKDGSYIIYDGGYADRTNAMENFLLDNYKGEGKPIIRAWVLTHSHNDHYPMFQMFTKRAKRSEKFIVEHVIYAPMNDECYQESFDTYFNHQLPKEVVNFTDAKVIFAHTGMRFTFCNLDMEILFAPETHYKTTSSLGNFNNTSIVSRLTGEGYSALFTGDIAIQGSTIIENLYREYLKSDMCQISHHGVEDVPLSFYELVQASILFYPCSLELYDQTERHWEERQAMEDWACTKEILIAGLNTYTRAWGTTFDADAPLSMPDYTPPEAD